MLILLRTWVDEMAINALHQLHLTRLRVERLLLAIPGKHHRPRVLATACWKFPIYSQTFVYQEITHLIREGFAVRFLYGQLDSRDYLPNQFDRLWRARRKVIFHPSVCQRDYAYFTKGMPDKIDALVDMLSCASGLSPQQLRSHYHFLQAFSFTRMVEAYKPDYLHSYFFYEGTLFTLVASYLLNIPRGVSCYADHMLKDYALKVVALHLNQCSIVVATSRRIQQELSSMAPHIHPSHILVKPNAINAAQFAVVRHDDPVKEEHYRLICVSRIEPKKGLLYLVEAVRHLRDRGLNVEAHLIGGVDDTPSSQEFARKLDRRIKELSLEDVVHCEGFKAEADIKRFFQISHLFVAPFVETETGDKDGVPTALLEAMAAGLPVVATDAGSILEILENGRDGILVAQRDPLALADAIETLVRNPYRRQQLAKEAINTVHHRFDVRVCERIFHDRVRAAINTRSM
jgi:glycosyltransferase involved in cell wall biosynthesis